MNENLKQAKRAKNDEFYTRLEAIEQELCHYNNYFENKIIYCNCDDPNFSNFWTYFRLKFNSLRLKKLIATCYKENSHGLKWIIDRDEEGNQKEIEKYDLNGDGDFRSDECKELLQESDIVCTNPPFSLFREFIALIMEYEKKFLVIGNMNAVTYKEIFPLIKENKIWPGYSFNKTIEFIMPDTYELKGKAFIDDKGKKHGFVPGIAWFSNIENRKRNEELLLYKHYNPEEFPKYDNYDAINISKVIDIPVDYDGIMGVPITFLDKYNPNQFEIKGILNSSSDEEAGIPNLKYYNDFKEMRQDMSYTGASGVKVNGNPVLKGKPNKGNFLYNSNTNEYRYSTYARILIKRKE